MAAPKKKNEKRSASEILANVLAGLEKRAESGKVTAAELKFLEERAAAEERGPEVPPKDQGAEDTEEYIGSLGGLADALAITPETLRVYRKSKTDPGKTSKGWPLGPYREWLSKERGENDANAKAAQIKGDPEEFGMKPGAANSLRDIEELELQARASYMKSMEGDDVGAQQEAKVRWSDMLDMLGKFEKLVPQHARTGGRYYTEEQFNDFMFQLGTILLRSLRPSIKRIAIKASAEKNERRIAAQCEPVLVNVLLNALEIAWKHDAFDRPAADALKRGLAVEPD